MVEDKYTPSKLIDFKYTRSSPSNVLAVRVDHIREDLSAGGIFEESTVSVLSRALSVTTGSAVLITSRFRSE